jgi:hypothetical protein
VSDPAPQPELTPEEDAAVSRLLAQARHDAAIPDDVAQRLDGVLAGLSHADLERPPAPPVPDRPDQAQVVDLAAHRRRRRAAGRLLAAAAAVIVAGVGIGQVISGGRDDQSASGGSAAADAQLDRSSQSAESGAQADDSAPLASAPEAEAVPSSPPQALAQAVPLQLSGDAAQLEQQVSEQLAGVSGALGDALASPAPANERLERFAATAPGFACAEPVAGYGAGELLPAYYDGQPVVLALRPSAADLLGDADGSTQADLLECGTGASVTTFSVTLP